MRKSVAIFLHMEGDQPGYIADYLEQNNIPFKLVRLFKGDIPPILDDVIGLVFMGGTMSVNDNLTWLRDEIDIIKRALKRDIPILGHCLGGQLISVALNAKVIRNSYEEIGWHTCFQERNNAAKEWLKGIDESFIMFHWHNETFALPNGADLLFSSEICRNQAFVYKENVLAMQCHVEMTSFLVNDWSESWKNYLGTSKKGIQNFDQIKASLDKKIELLNRTADVLYGKWVSKLYENQTA